METDAGARLTTVHVGTSTTLPRFFVVSVTVLYDRLFRVTNCPLNFSTDVQNDQRIELSYSTCTV